MTCPEFSNSLCVHPNGDGLYYADFTADDRLYSDTIATVDSITPDDDAIVCTNALDLGFFLERTGCRLVDVACTDRTVPGWIDFILNCSPLKYGLFNAWVVAEKRG
jgi:hypothetical protein